MNSVCTALWSTDILFGMSSLVFFALDRIAVVDVLGADAAKIVNNLTTNEVIPVPLGEGRETFITDVRGKTVGHVFLYRMRSSQTELIRLIGPAGQSQAIADHIDRYTIREDAKSVIRDSDFVGIVLDGQAAELAGFSRSDDPRLFGSATNFAGVDVEVFRTRWLGEQTAVMLVPVAATQAVFENLQRMSISKAGESEFHQRRVEVGFPWYGIDIDSSNLPQEVGRDATAISFTKGCYLGQETVARIDAMGQVQRKLVRWSIDGSVPLPGTTLSVGDKTVGRLTSLAKLSSGETVALGFARRTHFDAGATASGCDPDGGARFTATVL